MSQVTPEGQMAAVANVFVSDTPVLWLSREGQIDVWEMFSDNSDLSAISDRQGLLVAETLDKEG